MSLNETIVTGRKYRVKDGSAWKRFSFWTKASDVECNDGRSVEEAVQTINADTSNSIKSLNVQDSSLVYETNGGVSKTIPLNFNNSLESLGITATATEINALHGINGALCTETKAAEIVAQKIPVNIGSSTGQISVEVTFTTYDNQDESDPVISETKYTSAGQLCKIGDLVVAWGRSKGRAGTGWGGCDMEIKFNNISFSSSDTYQFICSPEHLMGVMDLLEKDNNRIKCHFSNREPWQNGGESYVTWLIIGY